VLVCVHVCVCVGGGPYAPPPPFFNLWIFLVTELNNGKWKTEKWKWKTSILWDQFSPLSNLTPCQIKFLTPMVDSPPPLPPCYSPSYAYESTWHDFNYKDSPCNDIQTAGFMWCVPCYVVYKALSYVDRSLKRKQKLLCWHAIFAMFRLPCTSMATVNNGFLSFEKCSSLSFHALGAIRDSYWTVLTWTIFIW
jgi:hypothetical protein